MKKAMVITALLWTPLSSATVLADQAIHPAENTVAQAPISGNPLLLLPGMRPMGGSSLAAPSVGSPLPSEIISNLSNAPNPFDSRKGGLDGQTQISYVLSKDLPVTVTLYDLLGMKVRKWSFTAGSNGGKQGSNSFLWDGTNEDGRKVSKGGYLAQIEIETPDTVVTAIRKIGVIH